MDIKIELDNRDGYYYVKERVSKQWKMRSRHPSMDLALRALLNEEEGKLATEIFNTVGIS